MIPPCDWQGHVYEVVGRDTHGHPVYRCSRCQLMYVAWASNNTATPPTETP